MKLKRQLQYIQSVVHLMGTTEREAAATFYFHML